jgi:hypothetical protein
MSLYAARLKNEMRPMLDELKELRESDEQTPDTISRIDQLVVDLGAKKSAYDQWLDRDKKALDAEQDFDGLADPVAPARAQYDRPVTGRGAEPEHKSISDYLVSSREFKNPRNNLYNITEAIPVGSLYPSSSARPRLCRAISAQAHGDVRIIAPLEAGLKFPLLSFLNTVPWNDLVVPYLPLTFTNNAREQAFAEAKAESTNAGTIATVQMSTIAHWKEVPRQILRALPTLRAVIDNELLNGVLAKVQARVVAGTGTVVAPATAPQMLGIIGQVSQTVGATPTTLLGQIIVAIGIVEGNGGVVDGILMNPTDVALLLNAQLSVYNPLVTANSIAGYPIIKLPSVAAGTALVGDFSSSTTLFVGEQANVRATEALGFKSNVVTVLGEMDAVVLVERPWLICKAAGTIP